MKVERHRMKSEDFRVLMSRQEKKLQERADKPK
jgi:hypothetical protein